MVFPLRPIIPSPIFISLNCAIVPVEYLVTGKHSSQNSEFKNEDLHKYHKYAKTIENLDALPENERIPIINMIEAIKNYKK